MGNIQKKGQLLRWKPTDSDPQYQIVNVSGGFSQLAITVQDSANKKILRYIINIRDKVGPFAYNNAMSFPDDDNEDCDYGHNGQSYLEDASLDKIRDGVVISLALSFYGMLSSDNNLIIHAHRLSA